MKLFKPECEYYLDKSRGLVKPLYGNYHTNQYIVQLLYPVMKEEAISRHEFDALIPVKKSISILAYYYPEYFI